MRTLLLAWLAAIFFLLSFSPPGFTVKGKVVGEKGQPLEYATVNEKGTKTNVATNAKGEFTITVSNMKASLVFSYVGFEKKTVRLKGRREVTVKLRIYEQYEDVTVIGHPPKIVRDTFPPAAF